MKKAFALIIVAGLGSSLQLACAGEISGKITLKGTPPKEAVNNQITGDANCAKMHAGPVTTHHFVVGPAGELANVVVSLQGVSAKSSGASAAPALLDQKGCEYVPTIMAGQMVKMIGLQKSTPFIHNVNTTTTLARHNVHK